MIVSQKEEQKYSDVYIIKVKRKKYKIYVDKSNEKLEYGDYVNLKVELLPIESSPGNYKETSKVSYFKLQGIYGSFKGKGNIQRTGRIKWNLLVYIQKVRQIIINKARTILPEETSEILLGIILGEKSKIKESDISNFKLSNMSHILAVSGMHVSYIIIGVSFILKKLPRRKMQIISIIFLIFFTALTNFTPSVVRAVSMAIISILSKLLHKKDDFLNSIFFSLLIILLYNPYLLQNIGLQLSFLGTFGIYLFMGNFKELINKFANKEIADILALSMSAQVMILPITMLEFNMLSMSFILSGFVATFLVSVIFLYGVINISISFISLNLSKIFAEPLNVAINLLSKSAKYIAELDILKATTKTPYILFIIIYYLIVLIIKYYLILSKKPKNEMRRYEKKLLQIINWRLIYILQIIVLLVAISIVVYDNVPKKMQIYFIDVDQGDSSLIISPKGTSILIDTGEDETRVYKYLLNRRINKLDYLILSHLDVDHCGGAMYILENMKVKAVVTGTQFESSNYYEQLLEITAKKEIPLKTLECGKTLCLDSDIRFDILWPNSKEIIYNSLNNNSLVCKLSYNSFSMLFTGDIEEIAEKEIIKLVSQDLLKSTILKVAHHGSNTSSTKEFIEAVNPKLALIGVGLNNKFGHPKAEVLEKLKVINCEILRTDLYGEIAIKIDKSGKMYILKNVRNNIFR